MKKISFVFLVVVLILCFSSWSWADKVHMKNGRVVSGKIEEENETFVRMIEDSGFTRTLFFSQIDRVEYDRPVVNPWLEEDEPDEHGLTFKKRELIRQVIEASGMRRNMEEKIEQVIFNAPLEYRARMTELFKPVEVIGAIIPLYGKYYSEAELAELLKFYQSPIGRKVIEVTPGITGDAMKITIQHFQDKLQGK